MLSNWLAEQGDTQGAEDTLGKLHSTLTDRQVLKSVLDHIDQRRKQIAEKAQAAS